MQYFYFLNPCTKKKKHFFLVDFLLRNIEIGLDNLGFLDSNLKCKYNSYLFTAM